MTAEEAIKHLKLIVDNEAYAGHFQDVCRTAIEALEEVEQYRALGTVEELKEAKEKQIPKKPESKQKFADLWLGFCPSCSVNGVNSEMCNCDKCGQAIDWGEGE